MGVRCRLGSVVAFVSVVSWMHTPHVYAIDWRVSAKAGVNVYRQGSVWIKQDTCACCLIAQNCHVGITSQIIQDPYQCLYTGYVIVVPIV